MSDTIYTSISLDEETNKRLGFLAEKEHRSKASEIKHLIEKELQALNLKYKERGVVA